MKKLILVLFVSLISVCSAMAQEDRIFYKVCVSNSEMEDLLRMEEISVSTFTNDLIEFRSPPLSSNYPIYRNYSAKKVAENLMLEIGGGYYFYKVDNDSFFVVTKELDAYTYFHTNRKKAYEKDDASRCASDARMQITPAINSYLASDADNKVKEVELAKEKQKLIVIETKRVITEFMKNYTTKRIDPALEKAVRQKWNSENDGVANPLFRVYFMSPTYSIVRNEFGIVLRKTVSTYIVYKWKPNGLCFMQWRDYGYESLGGGAFNDEIKYWIAGRSDVANLPGKRELNAGTDSEVDCAAFQK